MKYEENGIAVEFNNGTCFQWESCDAYRHISGKGVKEMDLCWIDNSQHPLTFWLIELKAFDNPSNSKYIAQDLSSNNIIDKWIDELYKKAVHSLSMLFSDRANTKACSGISVTPKDKLFLVFVIHTLPGQEYYLIAIQNKLESLLQPFLAIYNCNSPLVIPYAFRGQQGIPSWIV